MLISWSCWDGDRAPAMLATPVPPPPSPGPCPSLGAAAAATGAEKIRGNAAAPAARPVTHGRARRSRRPPRSQVPPKRPVSGLTRIAPPLSLRRARDRGEELPGGRSAPSGACCACPWPPMALTFPSPPGANPVGAHGAPGVQEEVHPQVERKRCFSTDVSDGPCQRVMPGDELVASLGCHRLQAPDRLDRHLRPGALHIDVADGELQFDVLGQVGSVEGEEEA